MNPDTNRLEMLKLASDSGSEAEEKLLDLINQQKKGEFHYDLVRPNGKPVPKHWSIFRIGEQVVVKDYTFKVAYVNESGLLLEPVGPVIIGEKKGEANG